MSSMDDFDFNDKFSINCNFLTLSKDCYDRFYGKNYYHLVDFWKISIIEGLKSKIWPLATSMPVELNQVFFFQLLPLQSKN